MLSFYSVHHWTRSFCPGSHLCVCWFNSELDCLAHRLPVVWIKFYLNTAMLICLHIFCDCFPASLAVLGVCYSDLKYLWSGPRQRMLLNLWSGELDLRDEGGGNHGRRGAAKGLWDVPRWRHVWGVTGRAVFKYWKECCLDEKLDPCLFNFIRFWDFALEWFSQTQAVVLKRLSQALAGLTQQIAG